MGVKSEVCTRHFPEIPCTIFIKVKIFIVLCESPLKILKIAVYRFLILFLVPELLMFKDLQNGLKNGTKNVRSGIKSIKIDKICDVM